MTAMSDSPHPSFSIKNVLKWLCACFLVVIPLLLVASRLVLLAGAAEVTTHIVEHGADVRFSMDRAYIPFHDSCVLTRWQVEGIQAVHINGMPTIGEGERLVCGEAPRLWITFQDGSDRVYRIERGIAFTPEYRLSALLLLLGLMLCLRLTGAGSHFASTARWRPRLPETALIRWAGSTTSALSRRVRGLKQAEPAQFYALLVIIAVGVLLRLLYLSQPMKGDEAATFINSASQPLNVALSTYRSPNNHLFHTFLVSIAYAVLGNAPWVVRLPVFLAGSLTIPAIYVTARRLYNPRAALLSAAVIAAAPEMIFFSTNARGYMVICLIFLLLLGLGKYLISFHSAAGWTAYVVLSALGFYTVPTMLYPFGILFVWLFVSIVVETPPAQRKQKLLVFLLSSAAAGVMTIALYLPVLINEGFDAIVGNKYVLPLPWEQFLDEMGALLPYVWTQWSTGIPVLPLLILVIGFFIGVLFHNRLAAHRISLFPVAVGVLAALLLVQQSAPFARSLLFLLPLAIIIACAGFVYVVERLLYRQRLPTALTVGIALFAVGYLGAHEVVSQAVPYFEETAAMREAEEVAVYLEARLQPNDAIISPLGIAILEYYFQLHDFQMDELYLRRNDDDVERVFTLVNRAGLPLPAVLERYGFVLDQVTMLALMRQFESYDLYLLAQP